MLKPEAKLPESLLALEVLSITCAKAWFGNKVFFRAFTNFGFSWGSVCVNVLYSSLRSLGSGIWG